MDLTRLGQQTAAEPPISSTGRGRGWARQVKRAVEEVDAARRRLSQRRWQRLPVGVEWLLDNAWLARREGLAAAEELRRGKRLRLVADKPYLQTVAAALVREAPEVDRQALAQYLTALQQTGPLTEAELSLLIPALRGELCRALAALCKKLEQEPEAPELAEKMEGIFTGLRTLATAHLDPVLEASNPIEHLLLQDPAGAYAGMDEASRMRYRRQVCVLARRRGIREVEAARLALELARESQGQQRHIGWFLFRCPLGERKRENSGALYVGAIVVPTLFVSLLLGFLLDSWVLVLLLVLPAADVMKNLVDFLVVRLVRPRPVPRMALKEGIPTQGRTLCVIAGLLTGDDSGDSYAGLLERYRLANRDSGEELRFGLLADLPDRAQPMGEEQRRWVKRAKAAIDALNEKHGGGFYLFFRQPAFQPSNERYVGWERKRGALLELGRLLRGRPCSLRVRAGDARALAGTKYVITLDSDTALNVGAARELVGAMLHPLNRPQVDPRRRVVTEGYGLLQPRVGVELRSADRSQFSRVFAGQGGIDPYGGACSDVYHDLFDRGTYTGKGIFDVDVFLKCLEGRFPPQRVLSHDLLEGAYLHAGLLADVELTDGYPYKVSSYFSRLHRWVRGDWQLLPWLGRWVRNEAGEWVKNPLSGVDKWKLFDNLRRSLSPVATLTALLLGMWLSAPAFGVAAALAIVSAWSNLLLTGADLAFRGGVGLRRRYHATIIAGPGGMILQTLIQLLLLPYHAWVCASAAATALWRGVVSHKNMLEWVTAAATEGKKDSLWGSFATQWSAVAVGALAMAFARFPAGAAVGVVWAASPAFCWAMSRPVGTLSSEETGDRAFLLHQAGLIWGYFRDWLREEDHWLPPDNVQEKPWLGPARRTSPTNIGMALLSCVAAADLELTSRDKATALIRHMLDTVEALPKWHGHLYNWYDTASCVPLHPRYVSTVDSGNLRGCLIALREALYQWGEDTLARRAEALSDAMRLDVLYDSERKLFTIGYDVEKEDFTAGWYDLMASEARLASYLAIALGEVDPRHWRRLGRGLVGENDYCGMASWTGTMFEYFMPNLLLPCEPGSLMYESLSFCVYAQKRLGGRSGKPWGVSESGFYAFDPGMAYQYKAHGVQTLGLKRGLDKELVVAPYASFLALLLAPKSAGRNLRRLRDLGLEGKYGLYEAVDFTPSRVPEGESCAQVRSFMSHHLGMSLVAIDNALGDNTMQRRFFRDCSVGAFRELLQEKVPVNAPVMRPDRQPQPERARPLRQSQFCREGAGYDPDTPAFHLLSNGLVSALCSSGGEVELTDERGAAPILTHFRRRYAPSGVSFFYRESGGRLWPLTPAPLFDETEGLRWSFDGGGATWERKTGRFDAVVRLILPRGERGATWTVTVEGGAGGEVIGYLEPVLARKADYTAHPAYSKLSLESHGADRGVVFTRRPRSGDSQSALAVVWDVEEAAWDTSREKALGRGGLRRLEQALSEPLEEHAGAVLDPCLLVRFPLAAGRRHHIRLALGFEEGEEPALRTAAAALSAPDQSVGRLDGLLRTLQLSAAEGERAMEWLPPLVLSRRDGGPVPQSALWPYGVSGDVPIVLAKAPGEDAPADPFPLKAHALLKRCGFCCDLVYLLSDGGDYHRPQRAKLMEQIKALGLEQELGQKGGIHLVEAPDGESAGPWKAWASLSLEEKGTIKTVYPPILPGSRPFFAKKDGKVEWSYTGENEVRMTLDGTLPPVGWSHLLVNPRFGWLTDETGCGHLWQEGNAREAAVTEWNNDPLAVGGPEWFTLSLDGEEHSLFADGDGLPTTVTYGFGWAKWEKRWPCGVVRVTAFVPWDSDRRILCIEPPKSGGKLKHISDGQGNRLYDLKDQFCLETLPDGSSRQADPDLSRELLRLTAKHWRSMVCPLRLQTPDQALDHYLNGWCVYQVIACRLLGRTSRYQNGGAYGFRDQLQDTLALLPLAPEWTRQQLLRCCAHQFCQGDVQHWWHETAGESARGVRTRISDDLLWLPYALERYLDACGDWRILSEQVNYLSGEPLKSGELERYEPAGISPDSGSVYHHALQAIRCVVERGVGEHGLLKMGSGDWNDGMNEVGRAGRGESVWLTWFAVVTLEGFVPIAQHQGDQEAASLCQEWAQTLRRAGESAWDGGWYLRGYYDSGAVLGGKDSEECQLDSIPQSWAALAGAQNGAVGVSAALEQLFDRALGAAKLFHPPFDAGQARPGYIRGYPPGVRENGGQYTHAATWLALACLRCGQTEEGYELLHALLPETHPQEAYRAEPYVLAGDVYTHPAHPGRGGWSWYTGAAGWYYQAALSGLLGITVKDNTLTVNAPLPSGWDGWSARWETGKGALDITVQRGSGAVMLLDGQAVSGVSLSQLKGEHSLVVTAPEIK